MQEGADYSKKGDWQEYCVVDGKLVTGRTRAPAVLPFLPCVPGDVICPYRMSGIYCAYSSAGHELHVVD